MKRQGKAWFIGIARGVAERLRLEARGTGIRVKVPKAVDELNSDEWWTRVGSLGKYDLQLEVGFTRFAGHFRRKLWAGFRSKTREPLTSVCEQSSRKFWPIREVTIGDLAPYRAGFAKPLSKAEFNKPILEKLGAGRTDFGIYHATRSSRLQAEEDFCACAAAFFEDVARALPQVTPADERNEVFPQRENRQRVVSHLQRERSRLLATQCKNRDDYTCQVCGTRFEKVYGRLGKGFAEAHHLVALSKLQGSVKTRLEDLRTVCANCHRMLHRMNGAAEDFKNLRSIVRAHQKAKA